MNAYYSENSTKDNGFFQDRGDIMIALNDSFLMLSLIKARFGCRNEGLSCVAHLYDVYVYIFI